MIKLDNGHKVLAQVVNRDFDVDGERKGAAVVIAFDALYHDEDCFVTWVCWPERDGSNKWIAEQGHYGLTWTKAWESMLERSHRISSNQFLARGGTYSDKVVVNEV